jgi:hypothetical protein
MPRLNGRITPMEDASAVSRDAGNPPVRFDVAGAGDGVMEPPKRARSRKRLTQPRGVLHTTAPVPDPTCRGCDSVKAKWRLFRLCSILP